MEYGDYVYQPKPGVKQDDRYPQVLEAISPDAIVVTAFGQILPQRILELPRYGCINVHASLLPRCRGSAPIQWAVINGGPETGVTDDDGCKAWIPEICWRRLWWNWMRRRPAEACLTDSGLAGGEINLSTLEKAEKGTLVRTKQPEEGACYAGMLDKALGKIDWSRDAEAIERLIRGLNPWPSAYTAFEGKNTEAVGGW